VDCRIIEKSLKLNKSKRIGKVLFIVEGGFTESYILRRIFTRIFDYEMNTILRDKPFKQYNSKDSKESQVFVINAEESDIKRIKRDNQFLNNLFEILISQYKFDIENAAIYYLFDRDPKSNTDSPFIKDLLEQLAHSREINIEYGRQGLLLLSYPCVESFTLSNFKNECFNIVSDPPIKIGSDLKAYLHKEGINHSHIDDDTTIHAVWEMFFGLSSMQIQEIDIDDFKDANNAVFHWQEQYYAANEAYRVFSLFCIALVDLGLVELQPAD
jgi:hypothetical protein